MNESESISKKESYGSKIYIREADGTSYEAEYVCDKQLINLHHEAVVICKGKILDLDKSLVQNQVLANQIINIRHKILKNEQLPQKIAYVSYKDKLYTIDFDEEDTIKFLKDKIQKQVKVPVNKQVILFNGSFLDESNIMKDYNIQNEDILMLGKIQDNLNSVQFAEKSFPVKMNSRNRRGSEGQSLVRNQTRQDEQYVSKFANSSIQIQTRSGVLSNKEASLSLEGDNFVFGPSSHITQEEDCQNFNEEMNSEWMGTKSESANSPVLAKIDNLNIFKQNNPFSLAALDFTGHSNIEKLNFDQISNQLDANKAQFNLETAFNGLLGAQEVVLCESYYEKQQPMKTPCNALAGHTQAYQSFAQNKRVEKIDDNEGKKYITEERTSDNKVVDGK